MSQMNCPHCQSENIAPENVPQGVIAVMPCPKCSQLLVRFQDIIVALNKDVLTNGSKEERTFHLAEVIAEFMDETGFNFDMISRRMLGNEPATHLSQDDHEYEEINIVEITQDQIQNDLDPISDDETQRFVNFELNAIDNMEYFKKHLE